MLLKCESLSLGAREPFYDPRMMILFIGIDLALYQLKDYMIIDIFVLAEALEDGLAQI
jgi:hypothetical protein